MIMEQQQKEVTGEQEITEVTDINQIHQLQQMKQEHKLYIDITIYG